MSKGSRSFALLLAGTAALVLGLRYWRRRQQAKAAAAAQAAAHPPAGPASPIYPVDYGVPPGSTIVLTPNTAVPGQESYLVPGGASAFGPGSRFGPPMTLSSSQAGG
jgi:hypothetical protein